MDERTVWLLIAGALVLGLAAVLLDRINFPQKRFRPKAVIIDPLAGAARDRTGAHVIDLDRHPLEPDPIEEWEDDEWGDGEGENDDALRQR